MLGYWRQFECIMFKMIKISIAKSLFMQLCINRLDNKHRKYVHAQVIYFYVWYCLKRADN